MTFPHRRIDVDFARELLINPDTTGTELLCIVADLFREPDGSNSLFDEDGEPVDPTVIWTALNEHFNVWVTEEGENRLNAVILALTGDGFYTEPEIFMSVCNALFDGDIGDPLDSAMGDIGLEEVLWGIFEVEMLRDGAGEFSPAVKSKIREVMDSDALDQGEADAITRRATEMFSNLERLGFSSDAFKDYLPDEPETMGQEPVPDPEGNQAAALVAID